MKTPVECRTRFSSQGLEQFPRGERLPLLLATRSLSDIRRSDRGQPHLLQFTISVLGGRNLRIVPKAPDLPFTGDTLSYLAEMIVCVGIVNDLCFNSSASRVRHSLRHRCRCSSTDSVAFLPRAT